MSEPFIVMRSFGIAKTMAVKRRNTAVKGASLRNVLIMMSVVSVRELTVKFGMVRLSCCHVTQMLPNGNVLDAELYIEPAIQV